MKSTVTESKTEKKPVYPCLMKSTKTGLILLALSESDNLMKGVTVSESEKNDMGDYSGAWVADGFTPFDGSVTLSND